MVSVIVVPGKNMIKGLSHITLAVKDIDKSFQFYRDVLGLTPLVKWDKGAYFLAGDIWFCLNVDDKREATDCYTHYAFSVSENIFDQLAQKIIHSGATIFKENTSSGNSLYFLDPDGHKLELHAADWKSRLDAKKNDVGSWENVEWYV